ncbi:MAG: 1-acyl-sn-glycerol-3-phosphate acyltransferase [Planctomycetota bacterium]
MNLRFLPRLLLHVAVIRPLLHLVLGLNVRGRRNLPERGPFLLAANHNSHLDVFLLFAALPLGALCRTHAVAARDYFARRRWLFAAVDYLFRPIWVDRAGGGGDPVGEMRARLVAGDGVVIFPEGTRGEAGTIGRFHAGAGRAAEGLAEVPLLPAFLLGPERSLPRRAAFLVPLWHHVTIGPPQRVAGDGATITRALHESILALARSETASRHRRRAERPRAFVVAVLGIDGSGKSTLSRRLAAEEAGEGCTCLIGDDLLLFTGGAPRAAQPLVKDRLRRWLHARAKDARSLARYRIPKLTELLLRDALLGEARRWYGPELVVLDGSPLLNLVAWSALYRPGVLDADRAARAIALLSGRGRRCAGDRDLHREFPILRAMRRLGLDRLALPDAVLFLDVEPAVAMERIRARGERVQAHESVEMLSRLQEGYRLAVEAFGREIGRPAFALDGRQTSDEVAATARRLLVQAKETIHA